MSTSALHYKIIGTSNSNLVVTSKSFQKFIIHQFPYPLEQDSIHIKLIQSKSESLLSVVNHNIIHSHQLASDSQEGSEFTPNIRIITRFYESTLEDMIKRRGTFTQDQLLNTLTIVLQLLEDLSSKSCIYGMLKPSTICFYQGDIKLGYGEIVERQKGETYIQADLRTLGEIMLKLATKQGEETRQLIELAEGKYSKKFTKLIKKLVDPACKNRTKVFEKTVESEEDLTAKKHATLSELNSGNGYQSLSEKIERMSNIVDEYLKRSKKIMQKSENKRIK